MPSERLPMFEYDNGAVVIVALTISQRPWGKPRSSVGGGRFAAAGTPAAYKIREDRYLEVRLRFFEHEWPAVERLIEFGQGWPNTITYFPDQNDLYTSYECYLVTPAAGTEWEAPREQPADFVHELTIRLRKVDLSSWADEYFE